MNNNLQFDQNEVPHTMTGLEARFEEEMQTIPGWKGDLDHLEQRGEAHAQPSPESEQDHRVEDAMHRGQ